MPPTFSAIKVEGNRAYDLARSGEEVVLEPRWIVVEDLRLIDMTGRGTAVLEAECGKGTYVRALARDMGRALGSAAHVIDLRRTRVGAFDEAVSVKLDDVAGGGGGGRHCRAFAARRGGARRYSGPQRRCRAMRPTSPAVRRCSCAAAMLRS